MYPGKALKGMENENLLLCCKIVYLLEKKSLRTALMMSVFKLGLMQNSAGRAQSCQLLIWRNYARKCWVNHKNALPPLNRS